MTEGFLLVMLLGLNGIAILVAELYGTVKKKK